MLQSIKKKKKKFDLSLYLHKNDVFKMTNFDCVKETNKLTSATVLELLAKMLLF